ncbi:30S ribosomal protein S10 [Candidatus Nomurabacteria bacterium]|nr:30S ribosomal protein S10 [Candidatus Nomurabacteria bacterium]
MTTTEKKTKKPKAPKAVVAKIPKTPRVKVSKVVVKKEKIVQKESKENKVILRIRVRAYESKILDSSVKQIMDTAARHDAIIVGPVPLPTEIKKYTVNRSPFIYKNTREQFEIRVHKRLIDIINPNGKTIEALTNLSLPSGVDIDVKML